MFRTGGGVTRISQRTHTRVVVVKGRHVTEAFDTHLLGVIAISGGLSAAMVWLATRLSMLEQRQSIRCPACGVIRRRGACSCSG
jgi:hypothetical protein